MDGGVDSRVSRRWESKPRQTFWRSGNLLSVGLVLTVFAWLSVLSSGLAAMTSSDKLNAALWAIGSTVVAVTGTVYFVIFFRRPVYRSWDDYEAALSSWELDH